VNDVSARWPFFLVTYWLVNRISIVKPDKARAVEDMVIRMARMGQLSGKLGEQQVIDLLEQVTIHR
jgi:DNA-binding TFAR19-related protein (PDSD5 family)